MEISYLQQLIYPIGLGFIKVSYFLLYGRLFRPLRAMRVAIWSGGVVSSLFYTLMFVLDVYFATPRRGETYLTHYLNPIDKHATQMSLPFAIIGLVLDFYILLLPIWGVWQLQLSKQKKWGVILIFMTGGL